MKKYFVYLDDSMGCTKVAVPADSVRAAKKYVQGNGEVVKVVEANNLCISLEAVVDALRTAGFTDTAIDFISRTLQITEIAD